jgi:predicted branched-subunit amino acid permease
LHVSKLIKPIAAQLTIDESNAVSLAQEPKSQKEKLGFWLTGIAVFVFWNLFTFAGALLGAQIGDPTEWGLDAAAAAAFLGLIWPRLKESRLLQLAVISAFAATMLSIALPAGLPVLLTALVALVFWYFSAKESAK